MTDDKQLTVATPGMQAAVHALLPRGLNEAMQLAEVMSRGKMMPEHLKTTGDAMMVIEQAMRWGMSPFAVAQNAYSIKGKLMYSGTLVAAVIENSGAIDGYLDYEFSGEGDDRTITVSAMRRHETKLRTITLKLKDARTSNEFWKKQPDQQLVYAGARVWARRWTPAVMLGVYTPEEMDIAYDAPAFAGQTIDVTPLTTGQIIGDEIPDHKPAPKRTRKDAIAELYPRLMAVENDDELNAILAEPEVKWLIDTSTNGAALELSAVLAEARDRLNKIEEEVGAANEP
jgi:hypothetical protein